GTATDNDGDIQQNGSNNEARVWQGHNGTGENNIADVDQTGLENIAKVYQGHNGVIAEFNDSAIEQIGSMNEATIRIKDETSGSTSSRNVGRILQNGDLNLADLMQAGDDHEAWISQADFENTAKVNQTGDLHYAMVTQTGFNNLADVVQTGDSHNAIITQN
ncbi:MAG: hypothetical protein GVY08_05770, partial [Bacteroidetes bacterium]|nr:hypothetical protein [Bacteroidota bacterium]